ncbi:hypothetical protein CVH13_01570, partial [Dehalococcoides mccartyi]
MGHSDYGGQENGDGEIMKWRFRISHIMALISGEFFYGAMDEFFNESTLMGIPFLIMALFLFWMSSILIKIEQEIKD